MKIREIARVCHEVNKAVCESLGDSSQVGWDDAEDWQKDSAVNGVRLHLGNPNTTPEMSHENWLKKKVADGWMFGSVKDAAAKIHPCMVPYSELPAGQKTKDYVFKAIVEVLSS